MIRSDGCLEHASHSARRFLPDSAWARRLPCGCPGNLASPSDALAARWPAGTPAGSGGRAYQTMPGAWAELWAGMRRMRGMGEP